MPDFRKFNSILFALVTLHAAAIAVHSAVVKTATVTNAAHFGYFGFASTSANNTKAVITPPNALVRTIRVQGTITEVHPDAWVGSIRVQPFGNGFQPWFQFSDQYDFSGTVSVSATIYSPGGFNFSQNMTLEMYSIDAEEFVPGLDARSTLTYEFDNAYAPGTVEYSGSLTSLDPRFNRPMQVPTNPPGFSTPFLTNRIAAYDIQPFFVDSPGLYSMVCSAGFDAATAVYSGSFDANQPLNSLLRAVGQTANVLRDPTLGFLQAYGDATGGSLITLNLQPGVQYYFVTTAYDSPNVNSSARPTIGNYRNIITGAGSVSLGVVPEPGLAGFMLGLLATLKRRCPRRSSTKRRIFSA